MRVHPSKQNLLSHKVLPISNTLLTITYDFGTLTKEIEHKYISNMLGNFFYSGGQPLRGNRLDLKKTFNILLDVTTLCQSFIKNYKKNESSVSLRDIDRVQKIFRFYSLWIRYRKMFWRDKKLKLVGFLKNTKYSVSFLESMRDFIRCLTVTIFLNYINRIGSRGKYYCDFIVTFSRNSILIGEYCVVLISLRRMNNLVTKQKVNKRDIIEMEYDLSVNRGVITSHPNLINCSSKVRNSPDPNLHLNLLLYFIKHN